VLGKRLRPFLDPADIMGWVVILGLCHVFSFKRVSLYEFKVMLEGVKHQAYCFIDNKLSFRFGESFEKA